jgi:hydroxymethylglutaryl-CoA reductase (NADPH)
MSATNDRRPIPRRDDDDYCADAVDARRAFIRERTGERLHHVCAHSIDPQTTRGNIEQFLGAAQVPIGVAGPLLVNGEHARGEFYVPLATTEGTLVASYNRGMRMLYEAGGVTTTVVDDHMQRAPVFVLHSAREAREFGAWLTEHFDEIKAVAETTTRSGQLQDIERYAAGRQLYTRFDYTTGDAAGQNMTGKATQRACEWILEHHEGIERYLLEGAFAGDKKSSQVNMLRTRGKRVIAEAVVPDELLGRTMRTSSATLFRARQLSNLGGFMAGANNNGAHSANAIAALFIATGQDPANVVESSAAYIHAERRDNGDYYYSVTIPALIVATYGGGTGLPTQRECLEMLGCYGTGKVRKLAEIVAATVLCGELSLGSAVVAEEWVDAHDQLGRNRP